MFCTSASLKPGALMIGTLFVDFTFIVYRWHWHLSFYCIWYLFEFSITLNCLNMVFTNITTLVSSNLKTKSHHFKIFYVYILNLYVISIEYSFDSFWVDSQNLHLVSMTSSFVVIVFVTVCWKGSLNFVFCFLSKPIIGPIILVKTCCDKQKKPNLLCDIVILKIHPLAPHRCWKLLVEGLSKGLQGNSILVAGVGNLYHFYLALWSCDWVAKVLDS